MANNEQLRQITEREPSECPLVEPGSTTVIKSDSDFSTLGIKKSTI